MYHIREHKLTIHARYTLHIISKMYRALVYFMIILYYLILIMFSEGCVGLWSALLYFISSWEKSSELNISTM